MINVHNLKQGIKQQKSAPRFMYFSQNKPISSGDEREYDSRERSHKSVKNNWH